MSRYGLVLNVDVVVPLCHRLLLYNGGLGVIFIIVVVVPSPPCQRRGGVVVVIIVTISSLPTFLVDCCVMGVLMHLTSSLRASYAVVDIMRCRHRCLSSSLFVVVIVVVCRRRCSSSSLFVVLVVRRRHR